MASCGDSGPSEPTSPAGNVSVSVEPKELSLKIAELTRFLYARFYRHPHLQELADHAERSLRTLFAGYLARPEEMAPWYQRWADQVGIERAVCDYIAGMTDRFAQTEYTRQVGG